MHSLCRYLWELSLYKILFHFKAFVHERIIGLTLTLIQVGATTLNEYRAIEKDAALARRFQPVMVLEPTAAESLTILRG